ncbi:hypothetical protein QPK87_10700 [Kamptonema cortianum]|nr:hypothetical protein [Geitlerinema splendidum]MDK3157043.1 hypothetical protein [Kamptonema cortianum]
MRVFFSSGEASGDAYAAELIRRLPGCEIEAVAGNKTKSLIGDLVADNSHWGSIGILESLKVAPRVVHGYRQAVRRLESGTRGVLVPIDYGYMNIRLARRAKQLGWHVLYFIPPGSWRKDKQGSDLPDITDTIVTPFEWSAEILNKMGANAHWFGHPLVQMVSQATAESSERSGIAVLPGSRIHEIASNLPVIAQATQNLQETIRFGVAQSVDEAKLRALWKKVGGGSAEFSSETYSILKSSRAAIICSGTATLESALCRCPTIVVYRGNKLMEIEYRIRRPKFDYISLPNILLNRPILPELIQWDASPQTVRQHLDSLLIDGEARSAQLSAFEELASVLGGSHCLDETAKLILSMKSQGAGNFGSCDRVE